MPPEPRTPARIALLTDRFTIGGGLRHIEWIVRGMPDVRFGVFADGGDHDGDLPDLPNAERFRNGVDPAELARFAPDLIHVHHLKPLTRLLANPFRRPAVPVLFTAHGLHIHKYDFMSGIANRVKRRMRHELENYLFQRVAGVVAVSREDRDYLRRVYRVRHPRYIPNGIDYGPLGDRTDDRLDWRREQGLSSADFAILTVARFPFQKAHEILLEGLARIAPLLRERRATVFLVGDGPRRGTFEALAERLAISDRVRFMGRRTDVLRCMAGADLFLLPSRWEGLPITLLEAGGCRLPVLGSDTFGIRELISDADTGLLFENENAVALAERLREILDGRHDLAGMADRLHQRVTTQYAICGMIERLRELYAPHLRICAPELLRT